MFLVEESTPGCLPEEEPHGFEVYDEAVACFHQICLELEDQGWVIEHGQASRDNLAAATATRPGTISGQPRVVQIVRDEV